MHTRMSTRGAHPRSRGENSNGEAGLMRRLGSSPLTRGKPDRPAAASFGRGLIPAHAGKTGSAAHSCAALRAHPRSRGENVATTYTVGARRGSSPLTRGKQPHLRVGARGHRAHPRSRGENGLATDARLESLGSSPLTRGKHFLTCAFIAQIGQILESLELCASSESYSLMDAYATDAPQDRVRSIGLGLRSSRGAS